MTSLLMTALCAPAAAQTAAPVPVPPVKAASMVTAIPPVIVVARKRKELAQKTPIAMSVVTARDLQTINAQKFPDIQKLTPGLQFEGSSNNQYAEEINIRGQESNQQLLGIDPSVGIYVDGVYETSSLGLNLADIYGLAQIEVLKGPQGTLYGRNTPGGAINITTLAPNGTPSAQISQDFGSFGTYTTTADANAPLIPGKVELRIDTQYATTNGFVKDQNAALGSDEAKSFRGALKIMPSDILQIMIRGDYLDSKGGGEPFQAIAVAPGSYGAKTIAATAKVPAADAPAVYLSEDGGGLIPNDNDKDYDYPESGNYKASGGSVTTTLALGDVLLKSISAYRNFQQNNNEDLDASLFNLLTAKNAQAEDQWTQEFQLLGGALDDRLNYVFGVYLYDTDAKDNAASVALGAATPTLYRNHLTDESGAIYGQTTYAFLPNLHLTTGLRGTTEAKSLNTRNSTGSACNIPAADHGAACVAGVATSGRNLSYNVGLDYEPARNVMVYVNDSHGFKSGGINERGTATPGTYAIFKPEIATQYELGLKADFFNDRLIIDPDIYHTDYIDIQRSVTVLSATGASYSLTTNAARATINGADIYVATVPFAGALVSATSAYTYPHYSSYTDALGNHSDQMFEGVSRFTYGFTGQYTMDVPAGTVTSSLNWYWQSAEDLSPAATGFDYSYDHIQPSYGLLNARITWALPHGYTVAFYGTNLNGAKYYTSILDLETNVAAKSVGTSIGQLGAPREFGGEISKCF